MASPEVFSRRIARLSAGVVRNARLATAASAEAALRSVVFTTPVLTGFARSQWTVSAAPSSGERPIESAAATISRGNAAIRALAKSGSPIFLNNSADYINRLNDGWSDKAPAGFVERALLVAQAEARRSLLLRRTRR